MIRFARIGVLAFVLVAGLLVFAACGGDDDDNGGEPAATDAADGGDTTPANDEPTADDSGDNGDASSELEGLAAQAQQHEVTIAYDFSGAGLDGTMTLYAKPPDAWRIDLETPDGSFILITTSDTTYICTPEDGGSCLETPGGSAAAPVPFLDFLTSPGALTGLLGANLAGVDVERSSETIAGEDATCFSVSGDSGSYCFTDDGIMVRLSASSDTGGFSLEATSVERSVNDADLEPPYDVETLPVP
jgi:hypothetical protein